jgi:hypothetical protein
MFEETLDRYFSLYLGYPVSEVKRGQVVPVSCMWRLNPEKGWGFAVPLWAQIFRERAVISVRPDCFLALKRMLAEEPLPRQLYNLGWRRKLGSLIGQEDIGERQRVQYCDLKHFQSFRIPECRRLRVSDVKCFVKMKLDLYPNCDPVCQARDIKRNIKDGIAFGVFHQGKLVSIAEAPAIGPMQDAIEEMGVDTLPGYQRRGYGKAVISGMTQAVLEIGRIPVYRCGSKNEASLCLARAVGYVKYADIIQFRAP